MSRIWMPGGGGGGADLDVITADAGDLLAGKVIIGPNGEPLTGTLTLTGTAADSQVLAGRTYYSTDAKTKRTGAMANQGAKTAALNCGGSYTIPAGYHNGAGKVTANSLASQTGVQSGRTAAGAGQILNGYEAWVNGGRVTGNMANQGAKTAALNCGGSYTIPAGWHNGQGKVTANSLASQTDANAAAGDIRKNKTAWVKGSRITGTMTEKAAATYTPGTANQTIAASQFLAGAQTIKGDANLVAANIVSGKSIFGVAGNARVIKTKSGNLANQASTVSLKRTDGKSGLFYLCNIGNVGFTPLYAVIFSGYYSIWISGVQSNGVYTFNCSVSAYSNHMGYFPADRNSAAQGKISLTSTSAILAVPQNNPEGGHWYTIIGY